MGPVPTAPPPPPDASPTAFLDDTALLLFSERVAAVPLAEAAKKWSADTARSLLELVAEQKGLIEDGDVCLLREVKAAFKAAGIVKIDAREKVIQMMQELLTPKAKPKAEDRSHLSKEFLKAAQSGALIEMELMLKAHPSVLAARSSSKGYTPMHYAAMAGAVGVLEWLTSHGLSPEVASTPPDGSKPMTPAQVAEEYKRDAAVDRLRTLAEGFKFLKAAHAEDDDGRLRVAARAGNAAAVSMLLRREPGLARRPAALAPTGALFAAASGGHTSVLTELIRCGGVDAVRDGPSALQAAVAAQQADAANLLHLHERACEPLQVGHWTTLPPGMVEGAALPPLGALVVDAKLSRGRSVMVEAYDLQLASAVGAPAMERSLLRWIENGLGLPVWVPVDMTLYLQLNKGVGVAVDCLHSARQREQLQGLVTSRADALQRLTSVLAYVPFPSDVTRACRTALATMLGDELTEAQWARLTSPMQEFVAKLLFVLPITPWGARGGGMAAMKAAAAARKEEYAAYEAAGGRKLPLDDEDEPSDEANDEAHDQLQLTLCVMEVLSKARLLFHLFDDDHEAPAKRMHSVLPIQPDHPELCPYEAPKDVPPHAADASSYAAVLLLLSPVSPAYLRRLYPQCLLLNGGGIGGEVREKLGHRIALRLILSTCPNALAPWVVLPSVYSPQLALAALSKLGGPQQVMLRHPHAVKFTAVGGGEISMEAADLDEVLLQLLEPDAAKDHASRLSKRVTAMVKASHFWPEREGPGHGSAILLLEEIVPSQPLPQDGRKGWFDATHRAYCVHTPEAAQASSGLQALTLKESASGAATASDTLAASKGRMSGGVTVLSGCCRFPLQSLSSAVSVSGGVDGQHTPQLPHTAVPLGPEMAKGAFERRLPLAPLFEALHAVSLRELVTHLLSSRGQALQHLVGLSILGGATAGARELIDDVNALNFAHYEYFGRPFAVAASLYKEHEQWIDDFTRPSYAQKFGAVYARLVQKSVLRDVIVADLACVCCNALRPHNPVVVAWLKELRFNSQFDDVRSLAEEVYNAFYSIVKTGRQNEHGEPVANKEHAKRLLDSFMNRIP